MSSKTLVKLAADTLRVQISSTALFHADNSDVVTDCVFIFFYSSQMEF